MGSKSNIEWTDASWNPVTGCSKVSPGCARCYAETLSLRQGWSHAPWTPDNAAANVILHPDRLDLPLRWRQPKRIFVNSMSDLFHPLVPDSYIDQVFAIMAAANWHTHQVLTKRPERALAYLTDPHCEERIEAAIDTLCGQRGWCYVDWTWPLANVWLGTSVENQHWADERIPLLLQTPAAVRFLSIEPQLGPVDIRGWLYNLICPTHSPFICPCTAEEHGPRPDNQAHLHWVVVGGESGNGYRPFNPDWARSLRDQCQAAGVAFFFKQYGGRTPKTGGRLLDGRTWDEFPAVSA